MPSPRTSPAMRPSSPLSASPRFESLQSPSPRPAHPRTAGNNSRRANTNSLKLPALPRFHPANFPSSHSSTQHTPDGNASPQIPMSPGAHRRMYSDAQKQLFLYQRETVNMARASSPDWREKPMSPRLKPLGSPGPVTPLELELERDEGYLFGNTKQTASGENAASADELVDRLIREEARRRRASQSPNRSRPASR